MKSSEKSQGRIRALEGYWEGQATDVDVPDDIRYTTRDRVSFHIDRGEIKGLLETQVYEDEKPDKLIFSGKFYDDSFLKLEYRNQDEKIFQFGIIFLKLSADGRKLYGKFVGFGWEREDIVGGRVEWEKIEHAPAISAQEDFANATLKFLGQVDMVWRVETILPPNFHQEQWHLTEQAYRDLYRYASARKEHGDGDKSWVSINDLDGMPKTSKAGNSGHRRIRNIRQALTITAKTRRDIFETARAQKSCYRLRFLPENIMLS